jgi:phage tail tape measure protein, TP901 family
VQLVTRAMGDAGIAAEDYGSVLDSLTVAGQKSGISVDTLATNLAKYGAPMRQLGLDTQQSIALFAGWEKAGVNTEIAFSGMKKAISNWAAEGKDASVEFQNVLDKIAAAPDLATASTMAIEVFGAKAGPDLADAIQGGRFAVDEYVEALKNSEGAVQGTYDMIVDEVDDTARAQQTLKVALHDVGETIAKTAGPWLLKLAQYVKNVMDKFNQLSPGAQTAILAFVAVAGAIGPVLITLGKLAQGVGSIISLGGTIAGKIPALTKGIKALWGVISANPFGIIITLITAVVAAVIYLWNTNENFRNFILMCWQNIQAAALAFFNYLANIFTVQIPAAFSQLTAWIAAVFTTDWTTRFGVLGNLVNAFFANVSNIFTALRTVFSGIVDFVKGVFTGNWSLAWEGVKKIFKGIFDSFTAIAKAPLNGVIGLLNMAIDGVNKLISGFNGIGFDMPDWLGGGSWHPSIPSIPNIPYLAKGGVLQEGEAIVAEAGPEHIKLMNGRAVVTPLSGKAKNTPAGGGIGQQTNNFYNYKPRDGEKVARDLNRRLGISVRPVRV